MKQFLNLIVGIILLSFPSITYAQNQKGQSVEGDVVKMSDANTMAVMSQDKLQVYKWNGQIWSQKGASISCANCITISFPDSNTVAIAEFDSVRVYLWKGGSWIQKGYSLVSGTTICMPDSNTVAIGNAWSNNRAGHVRIYTWNGLAWVQKGDDIIGEVSGDESGTSVSMPNSNVVAIGAPKNDGNGSVSGHVRIFAWNGNKWIQKGDDIGGEAAYERLGIVVSMPNSNMLAISTGFTGGLLFRSGKVRVYNWDNIKWVKKGADLIEDSTYKSDIISVSMPDNNALAIRIASQDSSENYVRLYKWDRKWVQNGNDIKLYWPSVISMPNPNMVAIGHKIDKTGTISVYQLCDNKNTSANITVDKCKQYMSPSGKVLTSSGAYIDTISNVLGCDSIININLTIENVEITVNTTDTSLEATAQNASFQWLRCNGLYTEKIPNATDRIFVPTENGKYAVEVTQGNCTDISKCFSIEKLSLASQKEKVDINIYPNPTNGLVKIELSNYAKKVSVSISNLQGQIIQKEIINGAVQNAIQLPERAGWYIIKVQTENGLPTHFKVMRL